MHKTRLAVSLTALGSSLVLAASLALPVSAATATGPSSGRLIATGTVANTRGGAAPGAVVRLYAWPSTRCCSTFVRARSCPGRCSPPPRPAQPVRTPSVSRQRRCGQRQHRVATRTWKPTRGWRPGSSPARHREPPRSFTSTCRVPLRPATAVAGCSSTRSTRPGAWWARDTYGPGRPALTSISPTPGGSPARSALERPRQARRAASRRLAPRRRPRPARRECPGFKIGNVLWRTKWRMAKYEDICARALQSPASGVTRGGWHCKNGVCTKWQVRSGRLEERVRRVAPEEGPAHAVV